MPTRLERADARDRRPPVGIAREREIIPMALRPAHLTDAVITLKIDCQITDFQG